MEKGFYLIYNDSPDDSAYIKGLIIGSEEQAEEWCKAYNAKNKYRWNDLEYEKLEILTENDLKKEYRIFYLDPIGYRKTYWTNADNEEEAVKLLLKEKGNDCRIVNVTEMSR